MDFWYLRRVEVYLQLLLNTAPVELFALDALVTCECFLMIICSLGPVTGEDMRKTKAMSLCSCNLDAWQSIMYQAGRRCFWRTQQGVLECNSASPSGSWPCDLEMSPALGEKGGSKGPEALRTVYSAPCFLSCRVRW